MRCAPYITFLHLRGEQHDRDQSAASGAWRHAYLRPAPEPKHRHGDALFRVHAAGRGTVRLSDLALRPHLHGRQLHRQGRRLRRGGADRPGHCRARHVAAWRGRCRRRGVRSRSRRRILCRRHASALGGALQDGGVRHARSDRSGGERVSAEAPARRVRPFHGRTRRADPGDEAPAAVPERFGIFANLIADALFLGREGVQRLSRRRPRGMAGARCGAADGGGPGQTFRRHPRRPGACRSVPRISAQA
jgi:hypothetical protein